LDGPRTDRLVLVREPVEMLGLEQGPPAQVHGGSKQCEGRREGDHGRKLTPRAHHVARACSRERSPAREDSSR
jgi:hypothetical protein